MFAQVLITVIVMTLVGVGLYKLIMWGISKNKKVQAAFTEERQSLQDRLDDLESKKKALKDFKKSVSATAKLAVLEKELAEISAQIETLDAKRGK